MNAKRIGAILMAALLLVSAVAPAAVTAQTEGESLSLDVTQDETGDVTITVADNGTAVENATVNVTAAANDTYADTGSFETDANGTVSLSAPDEPATVTVEASYNGTTVSETVDLDPALGVDVSGAADGSVVVTVTRGDATVENATVNVTANTTYADAGEFQTDANGTVTLDNPEETVELTITAMDENDTATTSVVVKPVQTLAVGVDQADDGTVTVSVGRLGEPVANATVTVAAEGNDTYAAAGEYETDDTGTVVLPAPSEEVTVTVTATEANDTASTTAELEPPESVGPFGRIVSAFVDALKGAGFTGIGQQVSDFVTSNNPSNAGNSEAVSPPAAGNNKPVTPPGQEKKDDSRIVPAGPPVENPGQSNESAPGNSGAAPGQSDDSDDDSPGNSGAAPGQSDDEDHGQADDGGNDSPGNSGAAPGKSDDSDDENRGQADDDENDSPGNSGAAPGQSDDSDDEQDGGSDDADSSGDDVGSSDTGGGNGNSGGNGGGNGNSGGNGGGNGNSGGNGGGNGNSGGNGGGNGNGR